MELLKPDTQLIKAAGTSAAASWDDGGWGIANNASILSFGAGGSQYCCLDVLRLQVQSQVESGWASGVKQWPDLSCKFARCDDPS